MLDITAIILTKNEEKNIVNCLKSIDKYVKRIVIVDSGSTDETLQLAKKFDPDIYFNEYKYYSQQFNWGIKNTNIKTKWILRIDSDEVFTNVLWDEIKPIVESEASNVSGIAIEANLYFMGKLLKHGSSKKRKIMIFKKDFGQIEDIKRDAHTIISEGKTVSIKNRFIHRDYKSIEHFLNRYNKYIQFEACDFQFKSNKRNNLLLHDKSIKKRRKLKMAIYYNFPKFIRAYLWYIYNYYFKLGFLDGTEGKIYNYLECYWYRFMVDARIFEMNKFDNE